MILLNITNKLIFIYFQFQQNICKKKKKITIKDSKCIVLENNFPIHYAYMIET